MFVWEISFTHPWLIYHFQLTLFLHILLNAKLFVWEISLTHPRLISRFQLTFFLHILLNANVVCMRDFFNTSLINMLICQLTLFAHILLNAKLFVWEISLPHPWLISHFQLNLFVYILRNTKLFVWETSLTHPWLICHFQLNCSFAHYVTQSYLYERFR